MSRRLEIGALAVMTFFAVSPAGAAERANPFAEPSPLPFQAPQFDRIQDSDYQPALEEGMRRQIAEIERIAADPAPPTFENTIVAIEKSGRMLARANAVFGALVQANTNDALDKVETAEAPKLAAHSDAIYMNPKLFARVQAIYKKRDDLKLAPDARQVLEIYYGEFVHAGALLSVADQAKLRDLNKQLASLETAFKQKLIASTKAGAVVIDNKAQLAGLSDEDVAALVQAADDRGLKGKWAIPLQNTTQQPLLAQLTDRSVRERLFNSSWTRAEKGDANDTRATILDLARLRADKARLLGYPNYAAYVLYDQMADTPEKVTGFMNQLMAPVAARAKQDAAAVQHTIDSSGQHFALQPWDWSLYAEKLRKAQYDLDESAIKPYFKLDTVLENGVFYAANQLYGLTFKERHDLPVYQADVRVFDVFDADGKQLGLIYFDYFKRDNKAGGAWMDTFVGESKLLGNLPVVYNVANFTKPASGQPALITFDDVTTMFHEFGHALHELLSNQTYPAIAGANTARDFVEFPSQFNERWALEPKVLKNYAIHYKTGQAMPQDLVDKIKKSATFDQGYAFGEVVSAALLDMRWHMLAPDAAPKDVDTFETEALKAAHADFPNVPPRYRSSYFLHIWANGYSSGYYAYIWTEMLADDAYAWFKENGGMTRANGQRFRDMILSRGHSLEYGAMFRAFYGKDPTIGPLLEQRGLPKS